jgi:hypothetical protein
MHTPHSLTYDVSSFQVDHELKSPCSGVSPKLLEGMRDPHLKVRAVEECQDHFVMKHTGDCLNENGYCSATATDKRSIR